MRLRIPALLLLWVIAGSSPASADVGTLAPDAGSVVEAVEPVVFEASLSQRLETTAPIKAGETVTAVFELKHPVQATVEFPSSYVPDRWVLVDAQKVLQVDSEAAAGSTWRVTWGIYRPGSTRLDAFGIRITDTAGNELQLQTEPIDAKVISIFADATDEPAFADARAPVAVWVEDYTLAFVGGGALLAALIGLLAWWARRRQLLQPPPPPPPRAAHEIALEKLGALAGDDLVERGEYMLYWVRLSEAIREYLGRAYGFPGTELTTTEMVDALDPVHWPTGLGLSDVVGFLRRCDEVKFGGAEPGVDESTTNLRRAFSFVELTKPRPPSVKRELVTELGGGDTEVDEDSEALDTLAEASEVEERWAPRAEEEE